MNRYPHTSSFAGALCAIGLLALNAAQAASHSDAPLIKQDPQANITDVYAFVSTKSNDPGTDVLTFVVGVRPFSEPGDGVICDRFDAAARYSISPIYSSRHRDIVP